MEHILNEIHGLEANKYTYIRNQRVSVLRDVL